MSNTVIKVENLSKMYHLGVIGYGTLREDLRSWWNLKRGKEDPNTKIGEKSRLGEHGEFWALRDINLDIQQGDRVGIIGRNGAGKSTLLKIMSRITAPTSGNIKIKGKLASLLEVGTGFHGELTGRENIFLNGAILGMKRGEIQRKLDEIVEFAGVSEFVDTPVKRYSSGMFVRLAFSVAAHLDADILVVDEVLAVGDAEFQKKAIGKMEDISTGQGKTVLFVSHNLGTIKSLCNKFLLMKDGLADRYSSDNQILSDYLSNATFNPIMKKDSASEFELMSFLFKCQKSDSLEEDIINSSSAIDILVKFIVYKFVRDLVIGINIYDSESNLLCSYGIRSVCEDIIIMNESSIKFTLPSDFFNSGVYYVELEVAEENVRWIFEPKRNSPMLKIHMIRAYDKSSKLIQMREGSIAPSIMWSIN